MNRAEDLKALVEASRAKLAENLQKDKGLSKSESEKVAEKLIGATWDVGHINMIRKMGYSEQDVVREAEIIAPFIKHVHLSDNFGSEHTELPMGMGNVPIKDILEKFKGKDIKKVVEAGDWFQHFTEKGGHAFRPTLEAFGAPMYGGGPYWNQAGAYGNAYAGMGPINPAIHHSLYGTSFVSLPTDLGGEMPGGQSRFAGTPNQ